MRESTRVPNVRGLVAKTFLDESAPGSIRGHFAHILKAYSEENKVVAANLVHASGQPDEAKYEIDLWFDASELFDHQTTAEKYTF